MKERRARDTPLAHCVAWVDPCRCRAEYLDVGLAAGLPVCRGEGGEALRTLQFDVHWHMAKSVVRQSHAENDPSPIGLLVPDTNVVRDQGGMSCRDSAQGVSDNTGTRTVLGIRGTRNLCE